MWTIIAYIKSKPRFFNWLKNNRFLMGIISWLLLLRYVFLRSSLKLTVIFIYHTFCYYILSLKRDVEIEIAWVKLVMPNHLKTIDGAIEVLFDEFYDKLSWFNNVLDLWWYIWESAIRLATNNKNVVVYEAHPDNYNYLLKNISSYKNILSYNKAVVGDSRKKMTFHWWAFNMWAWNNNIWAWYIDKVDVDCVNILDVLKSQDFDAMKMDIEWSEYECMDIIMSKWEDLFKKLTLWIVEFHFYEDLKKVEHAKKIIAWIHSLKYTIDYIDPISNVKISLADIKNYQVVFILFYK